MVLRGQPCAVPTEAFGVGRLQECARWVRLVCLPRLIDIMVLDMRFEKADFNHIDSIFGCRAIAF